MTYLYLHGLGSSGQSSTASSLRTAGLNVVAPDYQPHQYDDSMQLLLNTVTQCQISCLIGTSMGGFYALKLAEHTGLPVIAVNSCFEPALHLQKYLTQPAMNYTTYQPIIITQDMLDQFEPLDASKINTPNIIIGEQDDLIPAPYQKQFCRQQQWSWVSTDWGHRVSNKDEFVKIILAQSNAHETECAE